MEIKKDFDLTKLNTFGVKAKAKYFTRVESERDLQELFDLKEFQESERCFLGGGSNILIIGDFDGIVILNEIKGIEVVKESDDEVWIKANSGEVWHDLVLFAVKRGYWGIENLSLIPGTVGAAPMQNIGAYGAELKDTLVSVEAFDLQTKEMKVFSTKECELAYRDSIFKNSLKGKYFITAVLIKLSKVPRPNTEYRALKEYLYDNNITDLSLKNISEAVVAIRKSKLPDPEDIGNAGSFFKNIFIDEEEFRELQERYPDIPHFREGAEIKIPAGWLIQMCGPAGSGASWKGYRVGNVGVHDKQALVLVNHGGATGEEIKALAEKIIASVEQKFRLTLTPEVNIL